MGTPLRERFENVDEAIPDSVVYTSRGAVFHRRALQTEEPDAACSAVSEGFVVVPAEDLQADKRPCPACFRPILEFLTRDPESPVDLRDGEPAEDPVADGIGTLLQEPDPLPEPLDEVPRTVMIEGGEVFHAPPSGTRCRGRSSYRPVPIDAIIGHKRPCPGCFDVDEVEIETERF